MVNIQSSAVDIHLAVRRSQLTGCSVENPHGLFKLGKLNQVSSYMIHDNDGDGDDDGDDGDDGDDDDV